MIMRVLLNPKPQVLTIWTRVMRQEQAVKKACLDGMFYPTAGLTSLGDPRAFRTVLRPALFSVSNTGCIQRSTNDVITHTRKVTNTSTANQDHTVLLQIVTDTGDVRINLLLIGQADTCDFTQS